MDQKSAFPLYGMHFLLLYALLFFQAGSGLPLPHSKPIYSHGDLHTGSASERFTPLEEFYKCLNTIQYNGSQSESCGTHLSV